MSSSLEQLNNFVSKSPSVASNDSMAEYGCTATNVEISDDYIAQQMTRSYQEMSRPTRPPPPRNVRRSSSPEGGEILTSAGKMEQSQPQEIMKALPHEVPSSLSSLHLANVRSTSGPVSAPVVCTKDNRTLLHLDMDTHQQHVGIVAAGESYNALPKPPLPNKPKSIVDLNKPNEVTKL